jgi:hypothetical protein
MRRPMPWYEERCIRTVSVGDKPYEVTISRKSKTVWVASGLYMTKRLEVTGQSLGSAAKAWANAAAIHRPHSESIAVRRLIRAFLNSPRKTIGFL